MQAEHAIKLALEYKDSFVSTQYCSYFKSLFTHLSEISVSAYFEGKHAVLETNLVNDYVTHTTTSPHNNT